MDLLLDQGGCQPTALLNYAYNNLAYRNWVGVLVEYFEIVALDWGSEMQIRTLPLILALRFGERMPYSLRVG